MQLNQVFYYWLAVFLTYSFSNQIKAQNSLVNTDNSKRAIRIAMPFMLIPPEAKAAGMGDVGAATNADAFSAYWNVAKLAFIKEEAGFSISHVPWEQDFTQETSLSYTTGYYRFDENQTIAISLNYFNRGSFDITNNMGHSVTTLNPHEYVLALSYARKLSDNLSLGLTGKFIYSHLAPDILNSTQMEPFIGNTGAVDIGVYYSKEFSTNMKEWSYSFGLQIENIGPKMSYISQIDEEFLPANLRLGTAISTTIGFFHKITLACDFSKLLVPSPPIVDSNGEVVKGVNPNEVGVISSLFTSFADAPSGMREEFEEVSTSVGFEYSYDNVFMARVGYTSQNPQKGNRTYLTFGVGTRFKFLSFDLAYLFNSSKSVVDTGERMRFSFGLHFSNTKQKSLGKNNSNTNTNPLQKLVANQD